MKHTRVAVVDGGRSQTSRSESLTQIAITMNAPSSLCPGYKQVDAFGPDEEYEDEEEISYVVLDLGNVEPTLVPTSSTYRLIVSITVLWASYIFEGFLGLRYSDPLFTTPRNYFQGAP